MHFNGSDLLHTVFTMPQREGKIEEPKTLESAKKKRVTVPDQMSHLRIANYSPQSPPNGWCPAKDIAFKEAWVKETRGIAVSVSIYLRSFP